MKTDTSGKSILIVDDNVKNLGLTAKILRDQGYLISLAQSGDAALKQLDFILPDLILLDIMMPVMDGIELCRIIKKNPKIADVPVIFLTASGDSEKVRDAFNAGGVDYITKPFRSEELLLRVNTHSELAASRKKIVEMNRTRDILYSVIAHDLRTPMSNLSQTLGAVDSGLFPNDTDTWKRMVTGLRKSFTETNEILSNLLTFTKMQSDQILIKTAAVDLAGVIKESAEIFSAAAEAKKISLEVNLPEKLAAFCDETTIAAVIRNLVVNAVKFTPAGGTVSITAFQDMEEVCIKVKDTGVGMPEEVVNKIFVKDEHYTTPGTNEESGTGIGTFIIRDFVRRNKGRIQVWSYPGNGTEITVILPAVE